MVRGPEAAECHAGQQAAGLFQRALRKYWSRVSIGGVGFLGDVQWWVSARG